MQLFNTPVAASENNGVAHTKVQVFANPLLLNATEKLGRADREANQDDMGVGSRGRRKVESGRTGSLLVFLACRIPETELDALVIDEHVGGKGG